MRTFQINVLIQSLMSSTCFEHRVFIMSKTICTCSFFFGIFSCWNYIWFTLHNCIKMHGTKTI